MILGCEEGKHGPKIGIAKLSSGGSAKLPPHAVFIVGKSSQSHGYHPKIISALGYRRAVIQDVKSLLDLEIEHRYGRRTRVSLFTLEAIQEIRQRSHVTLKVPPAKMEGFVSILVSKTDSSIVRLGERGSFTCRFSRHHSNCYCPARTS